MLKGVQIPHPPVNYQGVVNLPHLDFYIIKKHFIWGNTLNSYEGISIATRKEQTMNIEELNLSDETKAQVEKLIQSETDRVRTEYSQKLKTVNEELSQYKPKEKSDAEKALEDRISALEAKEKELANKEKAMTIANKLKEKELPEGLAQYLSVGDDVDKTIDEVGALFGNYFLNGSNKPSNHTTNKGITKKDFQKMGYMERTKLFQENPQLFEILNK